MVGADLLEPTGAGRGRRYKASDQLRQLRQEMQQAFPRAAGSGALRRPHRPPDRQLVHSCPQFVSRPNRLHRKERTGEHNGYDHYSPLRGTRGARLERP